MVSKPIRCIAAVVWGDKSRVENGIRSYGLGAVGEIGTLSVTGVSSNVRLDELGSEEALLLGAVVGVAVVVTFDPDELGFFLFFPDFSPVERGA